MKSFDVITIGSASRDAFVQSTKLSVVDDPSSRTRKGLCVPFGSKIEVDAMHFTTGGGGTNAAVTFARQERSVSCVCKVGEDVSGREVRDDLADSGVDTSLVVSDAAVKTPYSVLLLSADGERSILVYRGEGAALAASDIPLESLKAQWFFSSGYVPVSVLRSVFEHATTTDAHVAFNPSGTHLSESREEVKTLLGSVDVLILNREEAATLTDVSFDDERALFRALNDMVRGIVVMTEGPKGVLVSDGSRVWKAGIFKEQRVADRTGAGDAFGSGFVAGLFDAENVKAPDAEAVSRAIRLASANATSVVEHVGTKTGILTRAAFDEDARWRDLAIEEYAL